MFDIFTDCKGHVRMMSTMSLPHRRRLGEHTSVFTRAQAKIPSLVQSLATPGRYLGDDRLRSAIVDNLDSDRAVCVSVVGGTPLIIQLLLVYYGFPQLGVQISVTGAAVGCESLHELLQKSW